MDYAFCVEGLSEALQTEGNTETSNARCVAVSCLGLRARGPASASAFWRMRVVRIQR